VIVVKSSEGATDHAVAKVQRAFEDGDSTRELLPDAEVSGAPRYLVAEAKEPGGPAANCALARRRSRLKVRVDAASKIEAA